MQYKKKSFSILEDIEKKNIEKERINIKNLYLQKEKYLDQLKLLINYRNEYLKKLRHKIELGICLHQWNNYNNFIFILHLLIKDNKREIQKNENFLKENLKKWSTSQIKLKTWNYLTQKYQKEKIRKKLLIEQIVSDEFSQLKTFEKGSYCNVK